MLPSVPHGCQGATVTITARPLVSMPVMARSRRVRRRDRSMRGSMLETVTGTRHISAIVSFGLSGIQQGASLTA
jgi:hypothetical protein